MTFYNGLGSFSRKVRGFEIVDDECRKYPDAEIVLPKRGSSTAMAYDFFSPIDAIIQPGEKLMIWTDVKAYMQKEEALILNVRSSMGKYDIMLANTQGWVDADYYSNPGNDGNIGLFLRNLGDKPFIIKKGDKLIQGAFIPFLVADTGNTNAERTGGFGSSGK